MSITLALVPAEYGTTSCIYCPQTSKFCVVCAGTGVASYRDGTLTLVDRHAAILTRIFDLTPGERLTTAQCSRIALYYDNVEDLGLVRHIQPVITCYGTNGQITSVIPAVTLEGLQDRTKRFVALCRRAGQTRKEIAWE